MPSMYMYDVPPNWDDETIGLLLDKQLEPNFDVRELRSQSIQIQRLRRDKPPLCLHRAQIKLTFGCLEEMEFCRESYQSLSIPMTHGYHYFSFSDYDQPRAIDTIDSELHSSSTSPLMKTLTPPLHLQLLALKTEELEGRIESFLESIQNSISQKVEWRGEIAKNAVDQSQRAKPRERSKHCKVKRHATLAKELGSFLNKGRIIHTKVDGVPIDRAYTQPLLEYLKEKANSLWPSPSKQRKGVNSGNYLTIRQKHPDEQSDLWNLCRNLIRSVCDDTKEDTRLPPYTALAITRNFRGSPHRDYHDTTFQHVVALGNFQGGRLCTFDSFANKNSMEIFSVNVQNRLGRIDGRNVHYVSGFEGTERYSIVYYNTLPKDSTAVLNQSVHNSWMERMQ